MDAPVPVGRGEAAGRLGQEEVIEPGGGRIDDARPTPDVGLLQVRPVGTEQEDVALQLHPRGPI
jgi:hypothetical protein